MAAAVPSGVVATVTLATVVTAPEPLTGYAIARTVEERFGGDNGILRTRLQHAYDQVPRLESAGLIRAVGSVPPRGTALFAATPAGVEHWRNWLTEPIAPPEPMTQVLTRIKATRPGDYRTMLRIIDSFEALLRRMVHYARDPRAPEGIADSLMLLWSRRDLVARLQWCQHARDEIAEAMRSDGR